MLEIVDEDGKYKPRAIIIDFGFGTNTTAGFEASESLQINDTNSPHKTAIEMCKFSVLVAIRDL